MLTNLTVGLIEVYQIITLNLYSVVCQLRFTEAKKRHDTWQIKILIPLLFICIHIQSNQKKKKIQIKKMFPEVALKLFPEVHACRRVV